MSERYTPGEGAWMARRGAATHAAFVRPRLRPSMRLLDCGCGPGSLTVDLAEAVAPRPVLSVDAAPAHVAKAGALAAERGGTTPRS